MVQLLDSSSSMVTKANTPFLMDKSNQLAGGEFMLLNLSLLACSLSFTGMLLCLVSKILSVVINH